MQIQIVARGRNSASDNCCAINRSIRIQWHSVNQFLARRNTYGTFKQTGLRYSSSQFCHCVIGRVDVVRRVRGGWPQMILLFFIMRCTPIIRELIVATRYRCPLHRLPASRLLLPRSGLERSDFVLWPEGEVAAGAQHFRFRRLSRRARLRPLRLFMTQCRP